RLARNMVEAGKVIHLLDTNVVKDIRFVSHQFSNDANGKMLLGMLFVFSKHYSDDLSSKVLRGVRGNFREGKSSGAPKHGYIRLDDGGYRANGDNFETIKEAWRMRATGQTLETIRDYVNSQGYQKYVKKDDLGNVVFAMTINVLSKIFRD